MEDVFTLVKQRKIKPVIYQTLQLSEESVRTAHSLLKSKNVIGRVVLSPPPSSSL